MKQAGIILQWIERDNMGLRNVFKSGEDVRILSEKVYNALDTC